MNAIPMSEPIIVWAIKVLHPGRKRWEFLTPKGLTIGLRIHAAMFKTLTDATNQAEYIAANNSGVKTKVVTL